MAVRLVEAREYTSMASFLPQGGQSTSGFSGFAAQFGVDVAGSNQGTSPAFYAELSRSRQILGAVVDVARYGSNNGIRRTETKFLESLGVVARDSAHGRDAAITELQQRVTVSFDPRTSIVSVKVRTASPALSRQLASGILEAVSRFNMETRQSQASAERRFTQQRLDEVRSDLRAAEDALQFFLQRNRILGSAELVAQHERLQREVGLQQQVYATLAQAFERAKLEEVRDTPVITIIQQPEAALRPDPRHIASTGILTFFIGMLLAALVIVLGERLSHHEGLSQDDLADFATLKREASQDLKHPLRAIRRGVTRKLTDGRQTASP